MFAGLKELLSGGKTCLPPRKSCFRGKKHVCRLERDNFREATMFAAKNVLRAWK
jgi:hypothetical protein